MLQKFKEYLAYRHAKRTLTLLLMQQYQKFCAAQLEKIQLEKEALLAAKTANESLSPEEIKTFINTFQQFTSDMNNPEYSRKFFRQAMQYTQDTSASPDRTQSP